jgi:polyhydroxybutyrate depolymerase
MKKILILLVFCFSVQANLSLAQIENGKFSFEGFIRKYMVFLPQDYSESANLPLVIYLHSYGWNAQKGMDYTALNEVADTANFLVAYPSALPNWNSGIGDNPSWPTPDFDDVGFISALIDTLTGKYSIDADRIYACGYSNGGFMAYKLACQLSHKIAAIASVGGVISTSTLTDCNPGHSLPVLQIHGTKDFYVPINGKTGWHSVDQTIDYWKDNNECTQVDTTIMPDINLDDNCTVEKISFSNCNNNDSIIYYKIIDGGHTWPGAGPTGFSAGNTNQDFNASETIWLFFKNQKLISSTEPSPGKTQGKILLKQNYPNPMGTSSKIGFTLPKSARVKIDVFDLSGQLMTVVLNRPLPQGNHEVTFTSGNLPNGVYLYKILADDYQKYMKLIVSR